MEPRIRYPQVAPEPYQAMLALEKTFHSFSIDPKLLHMLKLRASQINGCAFCIDMHWKDLRALGETEERLYMLDAWEESPLYTDAERAALAWLEALTKISENHAPDALYQQVRAHFDEKQTAELTWLAAGINAWNRVAISMRSLPGQYHSRLKPA
jgi:AhpD family alkylhydroperoxidase